MKEVLHEQNNLHSPIYQNIIDDDNVTTATDHQLTLTPTTTTDCASDQSSGTPLNDSIQVSVHLGNIPLYYLFFFAHFRMVPSCW